MASHRPHRSDMVADSQRTCRVSASQRATLQPTPDSNLRVAEEDILAERTTHRQDTYFERRRLLYRDGVYYLETLHPISTRLDWWLDHFAD